MPSVRLEPLAEARQRTRIGHASAVGVRDLPAAYGEAPQHHGEADSHPGVQDAHSQPIPAPIAAVNLSGGLAAVAVGFGVVRCGPADPQVALDAGQPFPGVAEDADHDPVVLVDQVAVVVDEAAEFAV